MLSATPPSVKNDKNDSHFIINDEVTSAPDIASLKGLHLHYTPGLLDLEHPDNNLEKGLELEKLKLKNFQLEKQALNHTRTAKSR